MYSLKTFLLLCFLLANYFSFAQRQQIDSLQRIVQQLQENKNFEQDTFYIKQLQSLAIHYVYVYPDSTILLGKKVQVLSKEIEYQRGNLYGLMAILAGNQAKGLNYLNQAFFVEAIQLSQKLGEKSIEARAYNQMASMLRDAGVGKDSVVALYQKSLQIRQELKEIRGTISSMHNIGLAHASFGDYEAALEQYLEVLRLSEKNDLQDHKGHVLLSIAELYTKQNKYIEAAKYYTQAKEIFEQIGNKRGQGIILQELGDMAQRKGDKVAALQYYQQSLALRMAIKDHKGISYSYSSLGKYYQQQDSFSKAVEYYTKAIHTKETIHEITELPQDYNGIGQCFLVLHDYKNALQFTHKGLYVAKKNGTKLQIRDCLQLVSQIYKTTKYYDSSLYYFEQFKLYADSLNNQDIERKTAQLQAQYEFEKKEELLKREHEVEKRMYFWLNLLIVCVLIGALIFSIYIYKSRIQLQKSYNNLAKANDTIQIQATALAQQTQELVTANQTKDKIFAIIGHDLKSPIASLLGLLNLLASHDVSQEEFIEMAHHIEKNLSQVNFTLNNLLEWAKSQLKGIQTVPQTLQLQDLVVENMNLLAEIARNKDITITPNVAANSFVWADREQINLILRNLLSNAIKFSEKGGTISINAEEKEQKYYEITIRDDGVGMSAERLARLFDVPTTTYGTKGEKGTGLGLTLCKDFVQKNGGEIWVTSEPHKGSTFYFTLPKA